MNISLADYYQKYPYIVTLRKYWLEYERINEFPDYRQILSSKQINSLYNVIKKNTILEDYISGKKWGDNLIENNYITNLMKDSTEGKEIDPDNEDIQEEEIRNIFLKLSNDTNKNVDDYLIERKTDFPLYRLFFSFANMGWVSDSFTKIKDYHNNAYGYDTPLIVTPYFYDPNFKYNKSWKFQPCNDTPSNIALLVQKELNFLLMEQNVKRFRKEEAGLNSSQQLKYLKSTSTGNPIQEIYSYINHADLSQYDQSGKLPTFNPKPFIPKVKKKNFNPTIPYDRKISGISSSNLLTLQVVEALSTGNNNYKPANNLTNTDIIMKMREKNNLIGISSEQINMYNSPPDGYQVPNIIDGNLKINPKLYNQVSLKRIYY